jgi:hypothetical protein
MQIIDTDRLKRMEEAHGYTCALGSLYPLDCTPKNNVIVGLLEDK